MKTIRERIGSDHEVCWERIMKHGVYHYRGTNGTIIFRALNAKDGRITIITEARLAFSPGPQPYIGWSEKRNADFYTADELKAAATTMAQSLLDRIYNYTNANYITHYLKAA